MTPTRTVTAATAIVLLLAACSSLPLPANVDLKTRLGDAATGSAEAHVEPAARQDVEATLPEGSDPCLDLSGESFPVTLESAKIHWNVDIEYDGPELTGRVQARLFVAGPDEELFHPRNTLGPAQTVKLDRTTTRFAGAATLTPRQLAAVNDREVCWGVQVKGEDVGAEEAGPATIRYDVRELWMRIRFSVI